MKQKYCIMKKFVYFIIFAAIFVACDNKPEMDNETNTDEQVANLELKDGTIVEHSFSLSNATPLVVDLSEKEKELLGQYDPFLKQLFTSLCEKPDNDNICFSPMSLQVLLGMILNGFDENVQSELIELFWKKDVGMDLINSSYAKTKMALENTNCVKMSNGLWLQKGFKVYDSFLNIGRNYNSSEIGNLDFKSSSQSSLDSICQWAYDNTYGKIKKMDLENFGALTAMVLANTTWFSSEWASPFDTTNTHNGQFYRSDGQIETVKMMAKDAIMPYKIYDTYNTVSLAFKHNSYRMDIVVPHDGYSIESIIPNIDWSTPLDTGHVYFRLPRFHISSNTKMRPILEDIGAYKLFAGGTLSNLTDRSDYVHVEYINQTLEMDVSESGVEAAAGTVANVVYRGGIDIIIDRPFVFSIRDNASGSFLFMGKVNHID